MISAKYGSFLAVVFQQSLLVLIIRYSKTREKDAYLTTVAVWCAEVLKMLFSFILERNGWLGSSSPSTTKTTSASTAASTSSLSSYSSALKRMEDDEFDDEMQELTSETDDSASMDDQDETATHEDYKPESQTQTQTQNPPKPSWLSTLQDLLSMQPFSESVKLIIPAFLYVIQNTLIFYALSNLSVPTYQVSNQGKILTTAIVSRIMLHKRIGLVQYASLCLLAGGVALVNLSEYLVAHQDQDSNDDHDGSGGGKEQNQTLGLLAVLVCCFTSAICGVYFELIVKTTSASLHKRNFQLAFWSFLLATISIGINDFASVRDKGFFQGFDSIILLVVLCQAMTGYVVSFMLKYADAVLKGFATSFAVVVATTASIYLFDAKVSYLFVMGAAMVTIAMKLYSSYPYVGTVNEDETKRSKSETKSLISGDRTYDESDESYEDEEDEEEDGRAGYRQNDLQPVTAFSPLYQLIIPVTVFLLLAMPMVRHSIHQQWNALQPKKNMSFVSSNNETFVIPNNDIDYILQLKGFTNGGSVKYLRDHDDIVTRGEKGDCTPMLDVLSWIMDEVNARDETLMLTYKSLLHLHKDHDFLDSDGLYTLGDLDLWSTLGSLKLLAELEPELYRRFGWTMRVMNAEDRYVIFAQIMATCGHTPNSLPRPPESDEPGFELYPLPVVKVDTIDWDTMDDDAHEHYGHTRYDGKHAEVAMDLWQKSKYSKDMIYPARHIKFKSVGTTQIMHLQIPQHDFDVMECLYGDWRNADGSKMEPFEFCWSDDHKGHASEISPSGYLLVDSRPTPSTGVNKILPTKKNYEGPLSFTSTSGLEFMLPNTDTDYILELNGFSKGGAVKYLRHRHDITSRGDKGDCTSMLDVLSWIMDEVNAQSETLMVAYSGLAQLHREHDFVDTDLAYIDDDLDMWASFGTMKLLADLEPELFRRFGWTMRVFNAEKKYVIFAQLMATCGHEPVETPQKVVSKEPAIELYPIPIVKTDDKSHEFIAVDLWQKDKYSKDMIYPPRQIKFKSSGTSQIMHLQLPHHDFDVLQCLYGHWMVTTLRTLPEKQCWSEDYSGASSEITDSKYINFDAKVPKVEKKKTGGLTFTAETGKEFQFPNNDPDYMLQLKGWPKNKESEVRYLRTHHSIKQRGDKGDCKSMLHVLEWIMKQVNTNKETLMVGYGELIHLHRERDFVKKDKTYIDDDMDMWASFETIKLIAEMEQTLMDKFGWTMRVFNAEKKYVIFAQLICTCGHIPEDRPRKVVADEPAIEFYPIPIVHTDDGKHKEVVLDLWQKTKFSKDMLYPPRHIKFKSRGIDKTLKLQIPNHDFDVLKCLYGNWMMPSGMHAAPGEGCWSENFTGESSEIKESGFLKRSRI